MTIHDYDVEMCIVAVNGSLFVESPDFDIRIPYCGTLDLDDSIIELIMADAYERILETAGLKFQKQHLSILGSLENSLGGAGQDITKHEPAEDPITKH